MLDTLLFIPHGHCYLWKPNLVGLHLLSDALIGIAYYSIPVTLLYFVQKRKDIPFKEIFLLFGAFIVSCGTTHFMSIWTLWHPAYWSSGVLKAVTAMISVYTALELVPIVPKALDLPSPAQLESINRQLQQEIAERKQAETCLRESEQRYVALLAAAPVGIFRTDAAGLCTYVNDRYSQITGITPDTAIGQGWQQGIHPDDRGPITTEWQQSFKEDRPFRLEYRFQHPDNGVTWVYGQSAVERDTHGQVIGYVSTITDISDRKRAELALAASEAQHRAVLSAIPDLMLRVGADGMYRGYITPRHKLDIIPQTFDPVGLFIGDVLPANLAQQTLHYVQRALQTEELQVYEQKIKVGDRLQDEEVRVVKSSDDEVLLMIRDITDRKRAEAALKQSEKTNRIIIETIPDLLIQMDREGYYSRMLGGSAVHVKYPPQSSTEPDVYTVLPPDLAEQRLYYTNQAIESGHLQVYEQDFNVEGDLRHEEVRIASLNEREVLVIIRDVTDRKRAEQQLHNLVEATAATTGQNFFPTLVSHIAETLNVSHALVTEKVDNTLRTLAFWSNDALRPTYTYPVAQTPCERVLEAGKFYCEGSVQLMFPADSDLVEMEAESYLGIALHDAQANVIGHLCILNDQPIQDPQQAENLLRVFAARAAAELERQRASTLLEQLNRELEHKVEERTAKLRASEAQIWAMIEAIPDLLLRVTRDGTCLDCIHSRNPIGEFSPVQHHLSEVLPPELLQQQLDQIDRAITTRELQVHEHQFQKQDHLVHEEVRIAAISSDEALIIVRDITARKQAEIALRESEARWQFALEGSGDGIWDWNPKTNTVFYSRQWKAMLGYANDEVGDTLDAWANLAYPEDKVRCYADLNQHFSGETPVYQNEHRLRCKDGSYKWILARGKVIEWTADGQPLRVIGTHTDITERKRAEVQLQQTNAELARATRLKDEFLANMSHELRTPLNAILGMAEGLQEEVFGAISERQLKALQTIERSGSHLLELINDILDVAKIESGQMQLDLMPIAVAPLCRSSLSFINHQALKKRIQVDLKLPPNLPELFVDERRIRQVLINLLNNAVKFTPEEGCITLEVSHQQNKAEPDGGDSSLRSFLRIAVIDTGIGIAPEHIGQLFQPFVQIDSALNRQYAGTGLGLSLVKRTVELHNGHVRVTSEVGVGSCFAITLPCATLTSPSFKQNNQADSPEPAQTQPSASPLILLAEDNEANISTVSSYLKAKGYRVLLAKNGQEAMTLAQFNSPDLILLDVQMPGMDGLEVMRQIRSDPDLESVPIIVLTALAMSGDRDRCLTAGATEYLSKPVKLKQLATKIQELLSTLPY